LNIVFPLTLKGLSHYLKLIKCHNEMRRELMNEKQPENAENPLEGKPQNESEHSMFDIHADTAEESPENLDTDEINDSDEDDWDKRTLCSDGSCIGVIGPDGKCKECGKPCEGYSGDADDAGDKEEEDIIDAYETLDEDVADEEIYGEEDDHGEDEDITANDDLEKSFESEPSDQKTYWESRTLCSDGNCIGVIGPDGKCKECGKPFEG
jgi:hypothetical protein